MKKSFALFYVVLFFLLVAFVIEIALVNITNITLSVLSTPTNIKTIYGVQSLVSLGYDMLINSQTSTTATSFNSAYMLNTLSTTTIQNNTIYTVTGTYTIKNETSTAIMYFVKTPDNKIHCFYWK